LPHFPGIDLQLALAHLGGRKPLLKRILKLFREKQGIHFADEFSAALNARNWDAASLLAHSLKGVARTLAADKLEKTAAALELSTKARDASASQDGLQDLAGQLKKLAEWLSDIDGLFGES
jgi:HPt (histidine-containing phosphotransfer) domain-containing protein